MIQKLQEAFQCRNNGDNEKAKSLIKEYIKEAAVAIMAKKLNEAKGANQFSGSVGEVLTRHQNELNSIKDNKSLVDFLEGLKDEVKGEEPSAYLIKLIAEIKRTPSFNRNFKHVYNIILAGDGLSSINEEVEEEDLGIEEIDLDEAIIPTEDKVETLVDEIKANKEDDTEEEDLDNEEIDLDDETAEELDDEELVDLDDKEKVPAEETTEVIPTEDAIETVENAAEESEVVDTDEEMKELTSKFEELAAKKAVEVPSEAVKVPSEEEIPAEEESVKETSEEKAPSEEASEEASEEPVEEFEKKVSEEPTEKVDQDEVDIIKFIK